MICCQGKALSVTTGKHSTPHRTAGSGQEEGSLPGLGGEHHGYGGRGEWLGGHRMMLLRGFINHANAPRQVFPLPCVPKGSHREHDPWPHRGRVRSRTCEFTATDAPSLPAGARPQSPSAGSAEGHWARSPGALAPGSWPQMSARPAQHRQGLLAKRKQECDGGQCGQTTLLLRRALALALGRGRP